MALDGELGNQAVETVVVFEKSHVPGGRERDQFRLRHALGDELAGLGDDSSLDPAARYHDRILASDYDEVAIQLKDYAQGKAADEVYDDVILTALAQAKTDREQQDISVVQEKAVYEGSLLRREKLHAKQ